MAQVNGRSAARGGRFDARAAAGRRLRRPRCRAEPPSCRATRTATHGAAGGDVRPLRGNGPWPHRRRGAREAGGGARGAWQGWAAWGRIAVMLARSRSGRAAPRGLRPRGRVQPQPPALLPAQASRPAEDRGAGRERLRRASIRASSFRSTACRWMPATRRRCSRAERIVCEAFDDPAASRPRERAADGGVEYRGGGGQRHDGCRTGRRAGHAARGAAAVRVRRQRDDVADGRCSPRGWLCARRSERSSSCASCWDSKKAARATGRRGQRERYHGIRTGYLVAGRRPDVHLALHPGVGKFNLDLVEAAVRDAGAEIVTLAVRQRRHGAGWKHPRRHSRA